MKAMGYRLIMTLTKNYRAGKRTYTKERIMEMAEVYYAAGRMSDDEFTEAVAEINRLD